MLEGYRTKDGAGTRVTVGGKTVTLWGCRSHAQARERCVRDYGPGTLFERPDGSLLFLMQVGCDVPDVASVLPPAGPEEKPAKKRERMVKFGADDASR